MTKQEFLKSLPGIKGISVVFSKTTRMPMVFCHEDTADDYIYIYLKEEDALEKVRKLNDEKQPAFAVHCIEKEIIPFLAELRLLGVNAIYVVCSKEDEDQQFLVQLTEFLRYPDYNSLPQEKRPVENPSLHLSMLYFMQELRKPAENEAKKNLTELEEETGANIVRAKFLIPVQDVKEGEEANKRAVLLLKNEKGDVFIPLFTDGGQLRKFLKDQKCPIMVCGFDMVSDMLDKGNATGILINPSTANVALSKSGVAALKQRFC